MLSDMQMEMFNYIFINMDDAVIAMDMNGKVIYANPAAKKLFGLNRVNIKLWESIPMVQENDALIQMFINGIFEKKKSFRSLADYVNHDGKKFHLHVSLICEGDEKGVFLMVASDLTEFTKVHSAFQRYTSPDIADFVLTDPEGEQQGGTDREVSILMSDIRGFTMLSTKLSSSHLINMLNHYFESMSNVIERFGGTIIEFLGDGIFVVFGAPKELADHTTAAVSCAVEMQNAMKEVNLWNAENGFPMMEMGIGINTGNTAVGNIGSKKRMKYGCMGEAVNLAGRLESFTVGGQVFVSENTAGKINEQLSVIEEKSFMPKGARKELKYYDVKGIGKYHIMNDSMADLKWLDISGNTTFTYYKLDGKSVNMTMHIGRIIKLSENRRLCILETDDQLNDKDNVMIRTDAEDAYAKVIEHSGNKYKICFTTIPEYLINLLMNKKRNTDQE